MVTLNSPSVRNALLWSGTPDSAVDLNPTNLPGFTSSYAYSTNGVNQVGWGYLGGREHALVWSGTSESAVDLQALLPATHTCGDSLAFGIDSAGNIYGMAGLYAIEWSPVPEPSSLSILGIAGLGLFLRRRRSNA